MSFVEDYKTRERIFLNLFIMGFSFGLSNMFSLLHGKYIKYVESQGWSSDNILFCFVLGLILGSICLFFKIPTFNSFVIKNFIYDGLKLFIIGYIISFMLYILTLAFFNINLISNALYKVYISAIMYGVMQGIVLGLSLDNKLFKIKNTLSSVEKIYFGFLYVIYFLIFNNLFASFIIHSI